MPRRSPEHQTNIQQDYGPVEATNSTVNQQFHFYESIPALSTDYASRVQNFLTEYLGTPGQPVPFGDATLSWSVWMHGLMIPKRRLMRC